MPILRGLDYHKDGGTSGGWSRSGEMAVHFALRLFLDHINWEVTAGGWSLALEISQRGTATTPDFRVRGIGQEDQNLADSCLR